MFKLLRKIQDSFTDTNVIVEKIHNDFDTATEKLLNDAKTILAKPQSGFDKSERLEKLGFNSAAPVIQQSNARREKILAEELSNKVLYFQIHYPSYKFITEDAVKNICTKYGLLCALVKYYKGDVPEKNLREIENFKLREEDFTNDSTDDFSLDRFWLRSHIIDSIPTKQKPSFKICASGKDFKTEHMSIEDGYKLTPIPDPIVLQPVNGGYLIISKWGIEGEDETLVNEKMN